MPKVSTDASLAETARRTPYNFSIPRLCFHPTDLFPDRGDPIDFLKDSSATIGQEEQLSEPAILTAMDKKLQQSTGMQPQFRVVIGSRLWDFMTVVQYVGFNDLPAKSPSSAAGSWMSRHVLLTGISGSGKSTLLMTSAAFMTYHTTTGVYRVAGVGDARAWATSGDPLMYFALEMLVALRDYFYSPSEEEEAGAENADGWIEEAGFLVEPRALTSLADLRAWMLAIRDRLAQEAALNHRRDVRLKLIILVDQAEYLLEHPDCVPAQSCPVAPRTGRCC